MSLCKDCIKGVTHVGEPKGKWVEIGGVNSYVAIPSGDYPVNKAVLFLADVFGAQLINNQLLADDFAANGIKAIIPDYFNGDPFPEDALGPGSNFNVAEWFARHGEDKTRPPLDKVVAALKSEGVNDLAGCGYCFGARYAFDLAFEGAIKVSIVSHPSLLKVPDDLEKYLAISKAPLLINSCDVDQQFPLEACAKADEILGGGKFAPGYKREHFKGCSHGFAVRGDMSIPEVKAGKEGAFKAAVEWAREHL